jgi:hypothetical protein
VRQLLQPSMPEAPDSNAPSLIRLSCDKSGEGQDWSSKSENDIFPSFFFN